MMLKLWLNSKYKKTTCLSRICCQIKHEDVPQNQWIQQTYWRDVIVQQLAVSARKNPGMIVKQKIIKMQSGWWFEPL